MKILFLLSFIMLLYSFIKLRKSNKKLNIILWIGLFIVIFMCFNSVIVFLLSLINVKATLLIRSIINIGIALGIYFLFIKNKKKQSYYFDKYDLITVIILILLCTIICYFRYGFNLDVDFEVNDGAYHYLASERFYENSTLTEKVDFNHLVYGNTKNVHTMFVSYTNMGTLFQLGSGFVNNLYKLFPIFELFVLFISGLIFYFIIKRKEINVTKYILIIVITLLYVLGYPLNNLIYGFHYWGLSILIISAFILLVKEKIDNNIIFLVLGFILSVSIFCCYYLFIPCVYGSIGIYFLYRTFVKKDISLNKSSIWILIVLLIPFIIGIIYYILPNFIGNSGLITSSTISNIFNTEGDCYKNLISDFIFLLPLVIYKISDDIKNKKNGLEIFMYFLTFLYMVIIFIMCLNDRASTYYYYKLYNLFWLLSFIIIGNCLIEDNKKISKIYFVSYIVIILLGCFNIENRIEEKRLYLNPNSIINDLSSLYRRNIDYLKQNDKLLTDNTMDIFNYVKDNYDVLKNSNGEVPFITNFQQREWIIALIGITPINNYVNRNDLNDSSFDRILKDDNSKYFVVMNISYYKKYVDKNNYNIVYENDAGYILEKK